MMRPPARLLHKTERAVALLIVLAFVALLAGLVVAYLSSTATDRQAAHGSFNESRADQLARGALDIIVADLKQEIVNGSTASTSNGVTIYTPSVAANVLPMRSGNPAGNPDPIPNLVRRSVQSDPIPTPGVASRASAVNSAPASSSTRKGEITAARWNKHYLVPRKNAGNTSIDTTPITTFTAPDWIFVDRNGPNVISSPSNAVLGRYAYARVHFLTPMWPVTLRRLHHQRLLGTFKRLAAKGRSHLQI